MKKLANALIVIGVGAVSLLVLYSLKVRNFSNMESSIILFLISICVILGMAMKTYINRKVISKEKVYSRIIFLSLYFTSITYFLIKSLL